MEDDEKGEVDTDNVEEEAEDADDGNVTIELLYVRVYISRNVPADRPSLFRKNRNVLISSDAGTPDEHWTAKRVMIKYKAYNKKKNLKQTVLM